MKFDAPLSFVPLYMDRVWGGRRLETVLGRNLPLQRPIGESWELVDREDAQSVVDGGEFAGMTLHELWMNHREDVFGKGLPDSKRFPLLAKILDAQDTLSVQVHPPAHLAAKLGGEPKTEMWYLLDAEPGSELFAGFTRTATREKFEHALASGLTADLLHRIPVEAGDSIFIPSGRCHAIGAGCLIVEMQQNSDTTYRVFDWNRVGLDGKPRQMHVEQSLECMDFDDLEPGLIHAVGEGLVECEFFKVERWDLQAVRVDPDETGCIFTVLSGDVLCGGRKFAAGQFFLLPATSAQRAIQPLVAGTKLLKTTIPIH